MTKDAPKPPPQNVGLWVGLGCLGVFVLSCCLLTYWAQTYGWRWILNQGDEGKIWASRMILVGALEGTRKSCSSGAIGEDALPWFHRDMTAASRNLACALDQDTLRDLGAPERSTARLLDQTERAELAVAFGRDPALCVEHATGDIAVIGCFEEEEGAAGSIPYQIIDLTVGPPRR